MVDLNMFGKYLNLCTIMHEDIFDYYDSQNHHEECLCDECKFDVCSECGHSFNDNTRFYIYLGSMLGFLLGVIVTILVI
jgi:hypothetical protein